MKEIMLASLLVLCSCSASKKIAQLDTVPGCFAGGGVVAINTEKEISPEAAKMIPPVVKFPLEAIPEAKAVGLKGEVQFSFVGLDNLATVCQQYEAIRAAK